MFIILHNFKLALMNILFTKLNETQVSIHFKNHRDTLLVWIMQAPGMLSMMRELRIQPLGSHHLGIDDSKNIARVLQHLLKDGAILQITAKRTNSPPNAVRFLFQNRIK